MARAQTKAKQTRAPARGRTRAPARDAATRLVFVLSVGVVLAIATPASMILAMGLLPTLVAYLTDRDPEGYAAVTVGGFSFAALVPFLLTFWEGPHTLSAALAITIDVTTLVVVYAAAAIGWVLYLWMPAIAAVYLKMSADSRTQNMQREQEHLIKEWGQGLKEDDAEPPKPGAKPPARPAGRTLPRQPARAVRPPSAVKQRPSAGQSPGS